jgi:hypothetical protein
MAQVMLRSCKLDLKMETIVMKEGILGKMIDDKPKRNATENIFTYDCIETAKIQIHGASIYIRDMLRNAFLKSFVFL